MKPFKNVKLMSTILITGLLLLGCQPDEDTHEATVVETPESAPESQMKKQDKALIHPEIWPKQEPIMVRDPVIEQKVADLLDKMTLEEKVGQLIQPDINSVTPAKARELNVGSILNGGSSAPDKNIRNTPDSWLALADEFWETSTDTSDGGVGIPLIWGTDAVHGHSNIVGATVFPHNIGLGAANDPDLMAEIGAATALEILTTGLDWTFAPTVAVVRNDRWGRTYEGYSEDPTIVAAYAPKIVEGVQGKFGTEEFLNEDHILATAKHFVGDGGTDNGIDQGDNTYTEEELRDTHAAGYPGAIAAGAQTVMASYNSFHGEKMHGMKSMLTDVLVERMGFDGFVVGDWNGHAQVKGCSNDSCPQSFNAGLDMFMVPDDWEALYNNTIEQVKTGVISEQRLDQAVARILRVKFRAGIFDMPKPSQRKHAGDWSLLSAPAHKDIARRAVRQSLVLLKNENALLPLTPDVNVLVTGDGADNIGKQSGGWTLSWQGTGNNNSHFPNATSIYAGLSEALNEIRGTVTLSKSGQWTSKPDVAIVVFGENPYAEGVGDLPNVDYPSDDGLNLLKKFKAAGIPTVSVFISGRPLWVNPELNASDAFVAAWLPGSEGAGIADVLVADAQGEPRFDFTGKLSFSWPATAGQTEVNVGDSDYDPLFAYGYGLTYSDNASVPQLSEDEGLANSDADNSILLINHGKATDAWALILEDAEGANTITDERGQSPSGSINVIPADYKIQEDTFIATWNGAGNLSIEGQPLDLKLQVEEDQVLEIEYRVWESDVRHASISLGKVELDVTQQFNEQSGDKWHSWRIRLSCFAEKGADLSAVNAPLVISAQGALKLQVTTAAITTSDEADDCQ